MKSFTGKFTSVRGWALLLALLLGAGMMISACGDEEVPAPTTPAPPPPTPTPTPTPPAPEPEPAPEPPATPVGLNISASGVDFIEWSWNAVEGVSGYDVQFSADEAFTDEDEVIPRTAEQISYRREDLEAETSAFVRVRSAAGADEERITSEWSTHVTGMTMAAAPELPPAPANVRVIGRGSDYIEWRWDAVPGADGYQSHFSKDASFSDSGGEETHAGMSSTTRKVSNLDPEEDGYLRVRSYVGTIAEPMFGDWSAGSRGTTTEPPAAVALDAPDSFESSDPENDSIVLTWDEVDDAESYEVEQREDGESGWDDASCGEGGDNEVDDTQCIATGLAEGTDYEFRVRAVPADDDDAHTTSDWSDTAESRTTGRPPPDPTAGGMGSLNIRWHNGGDNNSAIVFVWDRQGNDMYETHVLMNAADIHKDNPCADVNDADSTAEPMYVSKGSATSQDVTTEGDPDLGPGTVRGLCVRDEGGSEASFAWGITPPEEPNVGTPEVDKLATTALEWSDVDLKAAFDYEVHLAADPERPASDNNIGTSSTATSRAVQNACDAGTQVDAFTPDIELLDRSVSVESGLDKHTGYLLCVRASNGAGTSAWAVPITNDDDRGYGANDSVADEIFTRPAAPPSIASAGSESTPASGSDNEQLMPAWEIGTRGVTNVPRNAEDFNLAVFVSTDPGAASLRAADCGTTPDGYAASFEPGKTDGLSGFEVEVAATNAIERLGYTQKVYLCAQANSGTDKGRGMGPWTISSVFNVTKPSTSLSTDSDSVTHNEAMITIKGWNKEWWYKTNAEDAQCVRVAADTDEATLSLAASTSYTVRAWDDTTCEENGRALGSTSFRTKATP